MNKPVGYCICLIVRQDVEYDKITTYNGKCVMKSIDMHVPDAWAPDAWSFHFPSLELEDSYNIAVI